MQTDHAIALAALIFVIVASGLTGAAIDRAWIRDPCPVASIETPATAVRQAGEAGFLGGVCGGGGVHGGVLYLCG